MANTFTATGAHIFIAPSAASAPADGTAYAALTWTEVGLVSSIGPYGDKSNIVTAAVLGDGRIRKAKGARDAGDVPVAVLPDPADAGQLALVAAQGTYNFYPIKVTLPNRLSSGGTDQIDYFWALVTSKSLDIGANDHIVTQTFTLAINSVIVTTPAA